MSIHRNCDLCAKPADDPRRFLFKAHEPGGANRVTSHVEGDLCTACEGLLADAFGSRTRIEGKRAVKAIREAGA